MDPTDPPAGVTIVRGNEAAQRLVQQLMALPADALVACDTEVMQFDTRLGPIGNGRVTCLSLYAGPEHDFGGGPLVWVDDLDGAWGTVAAMREWLEDATRLKVWHHYAFDRHVLHNWPCLVNTRGLGGDTMHMARLWDTARSKGGLGGYSLAALTSSLLGDSAAKRTMKEIFGTPHIKKDGTPGKVIVVPIEVKVYSIFGVVHSITSFNELPRGACCVILDVRLGRLIVRVLSVDELSRVQHLAPWVMKRLRELGCTEREIVSRRQRR